MPERTTTKPVDTWGLRFQVNDEADEDTIRTLALQQLAESASHARMLPIADLGIIAEPRVWFDTDWQTEEKWCYATVRVIADHEHEWSQPKVIDEEHLPKCTICGKEDWTILHRHKH